MTNPDFSSTDPTALYPIGTVSSLTGVSPITLRAWERRHGIIRPVRKSSGHRLYTRADIDLINEVVALVDRGLRIGQVREQLLADRARSEQADPAAGGRWAEYVRSVISAVIVFDEEMLDETYNGALSLYSIDEVTRNMLTPVLVELGERWAAGRGSIAEEHFFAFYLRNKLGARFHHRSRGNSGPSLLLACLPGEQHEIGLLLFSLAAHEVGFRLIVLGADMPLTDLAGAAAKARCDAIVLSGAIRPDSDVIEKRLPALVTATDCPVFVGGTTSVRSCDAILDVGAVPIGEDIQRGIRLLSQRLNGNGEAEDGSAGRG